jgi:hypothetical protein
MNIFIMQISLHIIPIVAARNLPPPYLASLVF